MGFFKKENLNFKFNSPWYQEIKRLKKREKGSPEWERGKWKTLKFKRPVRKWSGLTYPSTVFVAVGSHEVTQGSTPKQNQANLDPCPGVRDSQSCPEADQLIFREYIFAERNKLPFPVSGKPESSFKSSLQKLLDQQPLELGVLVGSAQIDLLINSGIFLAPPDTSTFQLSKYRSAQAIRRELLILKGSQQAESPVCKRELMRTRFGLRRVHCGGRWRSQLLAFDPSGYVRGFSASLLQRWH